MERIKKALELADRQRRTASDANRLNDASDVGADAPVPPARSGIDVDGARTRVFEPDMRILARHRLIAGMGDGPISDAYRMLRTRVMQRMQANGWSSLAISSPAAGSGKTLTAINLATSLAMEVTRTVLLADLDLRRPSIHHRLGYQPVAGLSDYLLHDAPLERVLFSPSIDRLVVLPGRESVHNSSEMLRSPRMLRLLEEAKGRNRGRLIVFDLPPLLAIDDALAFAPHVDALLLVVENASTTEEDLRRTLSMLEDVPLIGTVLNKADPSGNHYYHYA